MSGVVDLFCCSGVGVELPVGTVTTAVHRGLVVIVRFPLGACLRSISLQRHLRSTPSSCHSACTSSRLYPCPCRGPCSRTCRTCRLSCSDSSSRPCPPQIQP